MSNSLQSQCIPVDQGGRLVSLYDRALCAMDYDLGPVSSIANISHFGDVEAWGIDVTRDNGHGHRQGRRTYQHIISYPEDNYLISIPREAQVRLVQSNRDVLFNHGALSILSTSQPFYAHISAGTSSAPISQTIVRVSGSLLRRRIPNIDTLCGIPLVVSVGAPKFMVSLLELALDEGGHLAERQALRLCDTLVNSVADAIVDLLAQCQLDVRKPPAKLRLYEQIRRFIDVNLSKPYLNAEYIAEHFNVSSRYLRDAFSGSPHTLGSYIRVTRLARCRENLREVGLLHRSITEIAICWGFNDPAYFSRAYRNHFGVSPSEDRKDALSHC
jgi:AraC-like DNA-binding protein